MKVKKYQTGYVLRLDKGEEIVNTLKNFIATQKIKGAFLFGLGAAKDLTLGCYDLEKKAYIRRFFPNEWEIANLIGNVAWLEAEPIVHLHIVLGSANFNTVSGHLFSGTVTATCEIFIIPLATKLKRSFDLETGLNLLEVI
ncbi:MAG: PPC domain-containing DNA-binding protein [candidate division WOR-3 bacterium]